jgi:hypothetical protein
MQFYFDVSEIDYIKTYGMTRIGIALHRDAVEEMTSNDGRAK